MNKKISLQARRELISASRKRYSEATWVAKGKIINELIVVCELDRKHIIKLLNMSDKPRLPCRRLRVKYDEHVAEALVQVWYAANQICSKRLVPFLGEIVSNMEKYGHLDLPKEVKNKLLGISAATVDRILQHERRRIGKSHSTTKAGKLLKHQVPVRTYADWDDVVPGFFEIDLVAHCGGDVRGAFLNTLVLVDISTCWLEFIPLLQKNGDYVISGLEVAELLIPFPLLGVDSDNGSEFINLEMIEYCINNGITFTRGRAYKKNDQAFVEEKNGSVIRRLIGYDRYEGEEAWKTLTRLYRLLRLYVNFFQPSLKLVSKHRQGAHVVKKYDLAKTPFQRVLASDIDEKIKRKLKKQYRNLDLLSLLTDIQVLQQQLWKNASKADSFNSTESILPRFYRKEPKEDKRRSPRHWITRKDPFIEVQDEIDELLTANPCQSAAGLLRLLIEKHPDKFGSQHRRTIQRRVVEWRKCKGDISATLKSIMLETRKPDVNTKQTGKKKSLA